MISTICRLLGVIGPFPTPVLMSWRAMRDVAPCAVQSITPRRMTRQATISIHADAKIIRIETSSVLVKRQARMVKLCNECTATETEPFERIGTRIAA